MAKNDILSNPWAKGNFDAKTSEIGREFSSIRSASAGQVRGIVIYDGGTPAPRMEAMSDPTREEIDAKLEAAEARTQTMFVELKGSIERLAERINETSDRSLDASRQAKEAAEQARQEAMGAKQAATTTKWNVLFTAIGSLAVIIAILAIWMQGMEMIGTLLSAQPNPPPSGIEHLSPQGTGAGTTR